MISPNKILGALVYRTREALNNNEAFMSALTQYPYHTNCLFDGKFHLWHIVGTHGEIANKLNSIQGENAPKVKFPAFLDFVPIRQSISGLEVTMNYNIAISGTIDKVWGTETREAKAFDVLLRPIYEEFMNQVKLSGFFNLPAEVNPTIYNSKPRHTKIEVFTTGNTSSFLNMYGEYVDAIELHDMSLTLKRNLCKKDFEVIEEQNMKVTENIENILKL